MKSDVAKRIESINNGIIPEGYKKTKIGIVPVEWETTTCKNICKKIIAGATPSTQISEYWNGNIPWMSSGEIHKKAVIDTDNKITQLGYDNCSTKMLPEKCVLIALAGQGKTRGTVAYNLVPICTNQSLAALVPNTIYYLYLYYYLDSQYQNLRNISSGDGTRGGLNLEIISNYKVVLPPLPEQQKIAEILGTQDKLIELQERKINQLKTLKKGYLQKMFPKKGSKYPELRFKGFTDAWEQRKWYDTVDISTEMVNPTEEQYADMPHIAPGNIESFTGRILDNVKSVKEEQLISGKFRFRPDDVVYGKINPQLGKYFFATVDGLTSADAYVFNGKNGLTQKFLFCLLQTRDFFNYSVSVSKRSGMPKINRDELNSYNYLMPCTEEQEKIGNILMSMDTLIILHQRKLDEEKQKKKALMQLLLTGKVRVI